MQIKTASLRIFVHPAQVTLLNLTANRIGNHVVVGGKKSWNKPMK